MPVRPGSPVELPGRGWRRFPLRRALRPPWAARRREAARGGGGAGWGQAFDSASSCWYQPRGRCWLSLCRSPLSLRGCGMTPPPPGCAALGIPRARVPSPLARSGLLLRLLLLLLGVAATTQGHPRNGPRISTVWKGRWRRAAGGARDPTPRRAGAECEAPEGVRASGSGGPRLSLQDACGSG